MTIQFLLVIAAFVTTIASALNRCPLWVPVLLVVVVELIRVVPIR
jgi:hypothetical protein